MNDKAQLLDLAQRYETTGFLIGDPSWFMHLAKGVANQEVTAFVAACLSYGSRAQFVPKIQWLVDCAEVDVYRWVKSGGFEEQVCCDSDNCFYRLYTYRQMNLFFRRLQQMLLDYGTMGQYMRQHAHDGITAVQALCNWFADNRASHIVPKDTHSACKRICLFLRWMVRDDSPVDLGLWADFIDRRTLIMLYYNFIDEEKDYLNFRVKLTIGVMTDGKHVQYCVNKIEAK